MATSVLMASTDHQTGDASLPLAQTHDHNNPPIRRSSGRRKANKGCGDPSAAGQQQQKKKTPLRGMGVEKLERLRMQERLKKMMEINPTANQGFGVPVAPAFPDPPAFIVNGSPHVPLQFSKLGGFLAPNVAQMELIQNQGYVGFHGQMSGGGLGSDQFQRDLLGVGCFNGLDFVGKNASGMSRELSSTPNVAKCFSEHCNICHKKKKVNGENMATGRMRSDMYNQPEWGFLGLNIGDNQNVMNQENHVDGANGTLAPHVGLMAVGNGNQGVEVMAIHKKGSSSEGGSGGGVLMEYDFFPSSAGGSIPNNNNNNNCENDEDRVMMMKKEQQQQLGSSEICCWGSSSSMDQYMAASASASAGMLDGSSRSSSSSSSIDLSLRLSSY